MGWREALDAYELHLDRVEGAIQGKEGWPAHFDSPVLTDGLPFGQRERARALLDRTDQLSEALRERMSVCAQVLSVSREHDATGRIVLLDMLA